ncbi:MAG: gamma subclass chorismate mutase AroQ [Halioglobus sp.]
MRSLFLFLAIVATFFSSSVAADLGTLVAERLSYMREVAAYKWLAQLPVEDAQREQTILALTREQSLRYGLQQAPSEQFFRLQMEAAKDVQRYWFLQWSSGRVQPPVTAPDLAQVLRPRLGELGAAIMQNLGDGGANFSGLTLQGLDDVRLAQLQHAANAISHYDNRLEQVLDTGILRVATTGDYPPFSSDTQTGELTGIDIDMARNLALALEVELRWVKTSWPTLMADFSSGQFDIGMSGISMNLQRQKKAFFSLPYHTGGKTPIVRCEQKTALDSLDKIDQPGVIVVVNPGGTNALFVSENIRRAQVIVHADNRTIFSEIRDGRADVMFTDQIEVKLQSTQDDLLCAAMPGETLTFSRKAYLLPQDSVFKAYIDSWLSQRIGEGLLLELFNKHL